MRICFLNPQGYLEASPPLGKTDTGGQIVYVLELAKALGRQGVEVDIVTRQFDGREQVERLSERARIIRIPCGPDGFVVKEQLYELMPRMVKKLHAYIEANDIHYDAIHSHYWDGGYAGMLLQQRLGVPNIFTPHSLGKWKELEVAEDGTPAEDDKLYRYKQRIMVEKRIMRSADMVLMLSQIQRIKLIQHYTVDFSKIRVLYPGVDMHVFGPRKGLRFPARSVDTKNNILMVSRFVPAKGIDRAIDIFKLVAEQIDAHLYIVTANESDYFSEEEMRYEEAVHGRVKAYGLKDRITFLGYISDRKALAECYRMADLYLMPSRYEPFGLTTMEAMACGAVVVVSSAAGSCELIIDGVNGFIADMRDRKHVADLIVELLSDNKTRKRTSHNAALTIQKHLAWDVIARSLIENVYPSEERPHAWP